MPHNEIQLELETQNSTTTTMRDKNRNLGMTYGIDDIPPWYLCLFMALQHYLTMIGAIVSIPFILTPALCMAEDDPARSHIISTMIFVTGLVTFFQTTIGCRLPLVQGGTISFLVPTLAILNLPQWQCPGPEALNQMSYENRTELWQVRMRELSGAIAVSALFQVIIGFGGIVGYLLKFITPLTIVPTVSLVGLSLFENAADAASKHWGIAAGKSDLLLGLITGTASLQPLIIFKTIVLLTTCSQIMVNVPFPFPMYRKSHGFHIIWFELFKLFPKYVLFILRSFCAQNSISRSPLLLMCCSLYLCFIPSMMPSPTLAFRFPMIIVFLGLAVVGIIESIRFRSFILRPLVTRKILLTVIIMWIICTVLTMTDTLPYGHPARSDSKLKIISDSPWFRVPYPGQWGVPTVTLSGVLGMLAGVLACTVESISYYPTTARMCGAPPPPIHAINRGIGIEGLGTMLAGLWGSGNGTNTFGENVGTIGVTKVGSRRVIQWACFLMIVQGIISKFGAIFIIIPEPIIGGIFCVMFGMICAFGLSTLQYINLNSSRNLFILGLSIFFPLVLSKWLIKYPDIIQTGNAILDSVLTVLFSTTILVGGALGCLLDNIIPGNAKERGLEDWAKEMELTTRTNDKTDEMSSNTEYVQNTFDFPFGMSLLKRWKWTSYVPFLPTYKKL